MAEAGEKTGFFGIILGPDSIKKADIFRIFGLWLSVLSSFAVLGTALIFKKGSLPLFFCLGLGGFLTFVAIEIRRRIAVYDTIAVLRKELEEVKSKLA